MDQHGYAPAPALNRRLVRRDLHRSRAVTSVILGILGILTLAWVGTEVVLHVASRPALLASPRTMADWLTGVPQNTPPWALTAAGIGLLLAGVILLVTALGGGHRPRRALESDGGRNAVVVDDSVIASALANTARNAARVQVGQVMVRVGRRSATVDIRPTTGISVDRAAVQERLDQEVVSWRLSQPLRIVLRVKQEGAIGA